MYRTHKQPVGHATRGKTASKRMRRLDRWLVHHHAGLLRGGCFVDVGYGRDPRTTLEAATAFRRVDPNLLVVGLEIDPARVEAAAHARDARTRFRRGGFDLPLLGDERPTLIRAMNVLRQYDEDAVEPAHRAMLDALAPGGLLVEGTSSPTGHRMVVNLRSRDAHRLLFAVGLRHPLADPWELTAILPKNLIHRVVPGEPVHTLMSRWQQCWATTNHAATFGPLAHWTAAAEALWDAYPGFERRRSWLRRGYLVCRLPRRG